MFDNFIKGVLGLLITIAIGLVALVLYYLGYNIHGCSTAPYVFSVNGDLYFIEEYREEDGYYYATTIHGNEYKIPIGITVVNKNK